jgi:hypothetical protein
MSTITEKMEKLTKLLTESQEDAGKCDKGNKSAGTRIRKTMQEVIAECKEIRKAVLEAREK